MHLPNPDERRLVPESSPSRRGFIAGIGSAALGAILAWLTPAADVAGKKKRKRRKKRKAGQSDDSSGAGQPPSGNGNGSGGNGGGTSPPPGGGNPDPGNPGSGWPDSEEQAFLGLINAYRAQHTLGALTMQSQLGQAAEAHSQDLADHNITGHTGSDGSSPQQRIERAGYAWSAWGENVFWGSASAQAAFDWWRNSPDHDANMLRANFTQIGVGRAYNANSRFGWYWSTDFGRPR